MGRYSSVQAYADNNAGVRKVDYEQAAGSSEAKKGGLVKPEKVVNPYGSTAGAGSGDFHVYRASRNRELLRQQNMDMTAAEQEAEEKFQKEQAANNKWEEERTAKRRKKRDRQKNAKKRKENLAKVGIEYEASHEQHGAAQNNEEFSYTPGEALKPVAEEKADTKKPADAIEPETIVNDGSFLEMMKQKLQEQQQKTPAVESNDADTDA